MAQSVARLLNNISLLGRKRSAVRARVESFFCLFGQFLLLVPLVLALHECAEQLPGCNHPSPRPCRDLNVKLFFTHIISCTVLLQSLVLRHWQCLSYDSQLVSKLGGRALTNLMRSPSCLCCCLLSSDIEEPKSAHCWISSLVWPQRQDLHNSSSSSFSSSLTIGFPVLASLMTPA
jgi:hypothetical protein